MIFISKSGLAPL